MCHQGHFELKLLEINGKRAKNGALAGIRTLDPMIKSHLLYRLSYERTKNGASDRNRTGDNHVGNVMLYQLSYTRLRYASNIYPVLRHFNSAERKKNEFFPGGARNRSVSSSPAADQEVEKRGAEFRKRRVAERQIEPRALDHFGLVVDEGVEGAAAVIRPHAA